MSDLELERSLVPFGYSMMFADRDSVEEAFLYLNEIAQATDSAPHVITACMVYVNSLVKALHSNGQLNMDVKPDLLLALKPFLDAAEAQEKVNGNADKDDNAFVDSVAGIWLTFGDFRRLKKAIGEQP